MDIDRGGEDGFRGLDTAGVGVEGGGEFEHSGVDPGDVVVDRVCVAGREDCCACQGAGGEEDGEGTHFDQAQGR